LRRYTTAEGKYSEGVSDLSGSNIQIDETKVRRCRLTLCNPC